MQKRSALKMILREKKDAIDKKETKVKMHC